MSSGKRPGELMSTGVKPKELRPSKFVPRRLRLGKSTTDSNIMRRSQNGQGRYNYFHFERHDFKTDTLWQHCSNAYIITPNVTTNELSEQSRKAALPQSTTEPIRNGSTMSTVQSCFLALSNSTVKQQEESQIAILLSLSLANPWSPGTSPHLFLEIMLISFLSTRNS